jgi:2-oxoglutarate ferredoxin oxidoreductase subunit alpha
MYLANKGKEFDVLVEQAEDEIAALNMVIGAWYAGARGLATTSGGGFALMCEALSLSGITETPCVIHLAQRPGPATGLPTRTEQGDLNLALYGGHGEFPRIILSPGHVKDAAVLTQKAFWLADKYQVPVIVLTDQYILDSMSETEPFELDDSALETFTVKTGNNYKRYDLSNGPVSPRGIPGFGTGFVKADSDEHTEEGLITEDFNVRIAMNGKRLGKLPLILEDYQDAQLFGNPNYKKLFIGFGTTYGVLKEYVETSSKNDAFLYIRQVYPLHDKLKEIIDRADKRIVVENNATGQLAALLKAELSVKIDHQILKYNGEPFSIEEIEEKSGGLS